MNVLASGKRWARFPLGREGERERPPCLFQDMFLKEIGWRVRLSARSVGRSVATRLQALLWGNGGMCKCSWLAVKQSKLASFLQS